MAKYIPLSIVIASIVVPMIAARSPRPKRALTTMCVTMALLAFVWCMLCMRVYPVYVLPE